jgi:N-acetylmuramoyl-L-alanine amidase
MNKASIFGVMVALLAGGLLESRAQSRVIVVDAGHGGHDRGGVPRQRIGEKGLTLDVAQRLRRVLEADGYRVIMTRTSDVFIPLGQRVAIANSYRNSTFVSIHFNSARRAGANGIETYYYRPSAAGLATRIHRNVVAIAPSENRGIRRRGYYVLRRTAVPAVLVECGFLTNPMEGRYALNANYRQRLAEQIARGIRGQSAPITKPLTAGAHSSSDVLSQPIAGPDFVRAAPRARRYSKRGKYSRKRSGAQRRRAAKKKRNTSAIIITIKGQPWPV